MSQSLITHCEEGVLTITFNRPNKKNAIDNPTWIALREAFYEASNDDSIRCVLLAGAGDNFSSGVDLASFTGMDEGDEHPFESAARAVADFNKPLVAAAQGIAVGGGATVLFHADIVYVGLSLKMRLPFASLGLSPEWASSYMLQSNIGSQRAAELFYTAKWIDAGLAVRYGMAAASFPDGELLDAASHTAKEIAQWPLTALCEIKSCMRAHHVENIDRAFKLEREAMAKLAGSPDNIEAISAIFEKRTPVFGR